MVGIPSPFGTDEATFDERGAFVPEHLPEPGEFLAGHDVLTGDDHVAVHGTARELFEERGVYDMTFDYNLARLNLDTRHGNAGFRYAEAADGSVLCAEFTPTTAFCPQTDTLTVGAFRAWNGLTERHGYELVRIRTAPSHQRSEAVNERLRELEAAYRATGTVPDDLADGGRPGNAGGRPPSAPF